MDALSPPADDPVMPAGRRTGGRDLTTGSTWRTLVAFALPTLASNVLQSLNGSINAVWVGRLLGRTGLAATSNANIIMFMVFSLCFGFGMALTVMVGQTMGRRDLTALRRYVGTGFTLFLGLSLTLAAFAWLTAPTILRALGTPPDVYAEAVSYTRVSFLTVPAAMMGMLLQMLLRGTGDSLTPLLFVIPSALIDVGLNPVLILGLGPFPRLGIAGSATAGLVAAYASSLGLLAYVYARNLVIRLRGRELAYLRPDLAIIATVVRKGTPMGLQMVVISIASVAMIGLVNRHGTTTVAAYSAVLQLWTYIQMPAMAIGAAVSTMVAQNIGAGLWGRVGRITLLGVAMNLVLTGALVLSVTLPARYLLALFLGDAQGSIAVARHINLLATWSYSLSGVVMVLSAVPRANGATLAPLAIMACSLLLGRLGFAYALSPALGADAIWWSFAVGNGVALPLTYAYYRYGGWRKLRLLGSAAATEPEEAVQKEAEPAGRFQPAV